MLKIKKVVETEVELPAPDFMELTWKNLNIRPKELLDSNPIQIGNDYYGIESVDVYKETVCFSYDMSDFPEVIVTKVSLCKLRAVVGAK